MVQRREFLKKSMIVTAGIACTSSLSVNIISDNSLDKKNISLKRKVPVRYNSDIVIIGGGIAGVSAACSAAMSGTNVILIERFGTLGGMLTTGGVANFCGQLEEQGEVFDDILYELKRFNSLGELNRPSVFNHEILALVLQEILLNRNVKILLHTRLVDVMVKGNNITECIICGKSGLEAVRGKIFIDCSGDADLARYAGVSVMKGEEGTGYQLPMSKMSFVREVEENEFVQQVPKDWKNKILRKEDLPNDKYMARWAKWESSENKDTDV